VNGIVQLDINGTIISATISMNAIQELGLEPGKEAIAVIQATEVMMTTEKHLPLSARNQLPGTVDLVKEGVVNGIVSMTADCGAKISATISMDAIQELGLKQGVKATAVIKATSVMIGIEE
jgi:molybdate transport system regulatory protein